MPRSRWGGFERVVYMGGGTMLTAVVTWLTIVLWLGSRGLAHTMRRDVGHRVMWRGAVAWITSLLGAVNDAVTSRNSSHVYLSYPTCDSALERHLAPLLALFPISPTATAARAGLWSPSHRGDPRHNRSGALCGSVTSWDPAPVWLQPDGMDSALERPLRAGRRVIVCQRRPV